ncbi:HD domain-containing protein [Streptomyces sp. NPDC059070]|uniref:HD domain-containing protein n=1 Tax=Streptomyces sp. NPDC059070 TaxID=3346713 RepID=UPI00367FCCD3
MTVPSPEDIRALHEKHAPSREAFALVWTHCEIVWRIAEGLLDRWEETGPEMAAGVDRALVRAGCLLHDIGVYRLYDDNGRLDHANYLRHGVLGHGLLAEEGWPESLCRFCSCHTGVGLTRHDIEHQRLPLPPGDYLARTVEERLVMYADKFHSKTTPPTFLTADSYAAKVSRFGADKTVAFRELRAVFGEPELGGLVAEYGHAVR